MNTPTTVVNDIVYVAQISSTLDTTGATSLPTWGLALYPLIASGPTQFTWKADILADGSYFPLDMGHFYAAAGGIDSNVTGICVPCRARKPKDQALCLQ